MLLSETSKREMNEREKVAGLGEVTKKGLKEQVTVHNDLKRGKVVSHSHMSQGRGRSKHQGPGDGACLAA